MSSFHADGRFWELSDEQDETLKKAAERLAAIGIVGALKEARLLWAASVDEDVFKGLVERRLQREPLSHLVGYRDFYNHRFLVSPSALDPRPDTEALVVEALSEPFSDVLDLGTGSGCIILSLLAEMQNARGLGADVSKEALGLARKNAANLALKERVSFVQSDWFSNVDGVFDLIVSNPPYIASREMDDLEPEVRDYEPRMALTDEKDGLSCYREIVALHDPYLVDGGRLIVEIGPTQGEAVAAMMIEVGLTQVAIKPDLDGRDRVVIGYKKRN